MDLELTDDCKRIAFVNNTIQLVSSRQKLIKQRIAISLRTNRGEWYANITAGVPYLQNDNNPVQLLGKNNKNEVDLYIRQVVEGVEGVIDITQYSSELDYITGGLMVTFRALIDDSSFVDFENFLI